MTVKVPSLSLYKKHGGRRRSEEVADFEVMDGSMTRLLRGGGGGGGS